MKKYIYLITLTALSLLLTNCGSEETKEVAATSPVISVKVNEVKANTNNPFLSLSGKIQATQSADLSTRIMGYVNNVNVSVGDEVKQGQLLVSINSNDLQAKKAQVTAGINEATAAFNNAKKDYDRFTNLFAENSASQKELDDVTAHYEMAKSRLASANQMKNEINAKFAYTNITAPFSGVITSKTVEPGDMANPGMPLISIEKPGSFEVMAMVPETEISEIEKGAAVKVLVKSLEKSLPGKVIEISTSAKHTGGQFLVKIALEETKENLLSGMFATVQFPIERKTNTQMILIPKEALVVNGQLTGVYTVSQSNTALLRWLRIGRTYGDHVEILSGLNTDEAYIIAAEGKLFNGAKVSPSTVLSKGKETKEVKQ